MNELVKTSMPTASASEPVQYLTFSVLNESMAIAILDVDEIIEAGAMTRVPMSNNSIRGVINLRGNVVPVVDLASRLGGKRATQMTKRSCIVLVDVMLEDERHTMGMLVDEVNEILEIPEENIQKTPDFGTDIRADFIQRMGRVNEDFIILLNIERVLAVDELSANAGIPPDKLKKRSVLPAASSE